MVLNREYIKNELQNPSDSAVLEHRKSAISREIFEFSTFHTFTPELCFPKKWPLFSHASEVKGETHAGRKVRLNWVSNSQPPDHKSDTLTTEPSGWSKLELGLAVNHMHHFITNTRNHHKNLFLRPSTYTHPSMLLRTRRN